MAILDFLQLTPASKIGDIEIMASLEEVMTDTLQMTEHPVEAGAAITDHAFVRPAELLMRCGWSNSSFSALSGAVVNLFDGGEVGEKYIDGIYSQLLALQQSREPFTVTTTKRIYNDMLITSLRVDTDEKTSNVLMVTATMRQIIIVNTQATTLPPKEAQADAPSTQSPTNTGVKQVQPSQPAPGGSNPPAPRPATVNRGATGGW